MQSFQAFVAPFPAFQLSSFLPFCPLERSRGRAICGAVGVAEPGRQANMTPAPIERGANSKRTRRQPQIHMTPAPIERGANSKRTRRQPQIHANF